MKSSIYISTLLLIIFSSACEVELSLCLKGEGEIETRSVEINDITGIEVGIEADVVITEGDAQEIIIEAHPNVIDKIIDDSKINGETWEIDIDGCTNIERVKFTITLPTIKGVSINGKAKVWTEGVYSNIETLNLEIDGSGEIDFQLATVTKVDIEINGKGEIKVSGETNDQSIDINGSGTIRNFDLNSSSTRIEVSGDADCEVLVEDILRTDLSGSGRICYRGTPTLTLQNSGDVVVEDCN